MPRATSTGFRRDLVADLRAKGVLRSDLVEAAFLTVPRERFVPDLLAQRGLEAIYRDQALVTNRVSLQQNGRIGIGMIDRLGRSLAVVSVRSPWSPGGHMRNARARWRLDAYGDGTAAREFEELLAEWRELQRAGAANLVIGSSGGSDPVRLRFGWSGAAPTPRWR